MSRRAVVLVALLLTLPLATLRADEPQPIPDLVIESFAFGPEPTTDDEYVTATLVVRNVGGPTRLSQHHLVLVGNDACARQAPKLDAGEAATLTCLFALPPGEYPVEVRVDAMYVIPESNESNALDAGILRVEHGRRPKIAVMEVVQSPESPANSEHVTLTARVRNVGDHPLHWVSWGAWRPYSGSLWSGHLPTLEPGQEAWTEPFEAYVMGGPNEVFFGFSGPEWQDVPDAGLRYAFEGQPADLAVRILDVTEREWWHDVTLEACNVGPGTLERITLTLTASTPGLGPLPASTEEVFSSWVFDIEAGTCKGWTERHQTLGIVGDVTFTLAGDAGEADADPANDVDARASQVLLAGLGGARVLP